MTKLLYINFFLYHLQQHSNQCSEIINFQVTILHLFCCLIECRIAGEPLGLILAKQEQSIVLCVPVILYTFGDFRCKWTITLCQASSSENKERSYGSSQHKAALQGHQTKGAGIQLPAVCFASKTLFSSFPPSFLIVSLTFSIQKKNK